MRVSANFKVLPELGSGIEKFKYDVEAVLALRSYGEHDAALFAFAFFVHHEQFLPRLERSPHGDQSPVCIDLNGADILVKRFFAFVAVDQQRDLNADPWRAPALRPLEGLGLGVSDSSRFFGLPQRFEDFAQDFVRSLKSSSSLRICRNDAEAGTFG